MKSRKLIRILVYFGFFTIGNIFIARYIPLEKTFIWFSLLFIVGLISNFLATKIAGRQK